jgi:hypothetical protein
MAKERDTSGAHERNTQKKRSETGLGLEGFAYGHQDSSNS